MTVSATPEDLRTALSRMRDMLRVDGYDLDVDVAAGQVALQVRVIDDACMDCLIPKDLFATMAATMLNDGGVHVSVDDLVVTYPTG
jgi:hypothetical protein